MVSIKQQGQLDGNFANDAMREVSLMVEEPVTVLRWTGKTGGNPLDGVASTDTYQSIRTLAVIKALDPKDIFLPNSIYVAGDLRASFRVQVFGAEAGAGDYQTPGRKADNVLFRNRQYMFVGHINRVRLNSRWFWQGVLRQKGAA